jgi:hypothetical protein
MAVVLLNGIYLRPPLFSLWGWGGGGFLFCAINLNLEIFKKCSYDLFYFLKTNSRFFYFCVLELILRFEIMGSLICFKEIE